MAIIPESQYPGKITPASSEYPYGQARNITLPGDGTGTPWEAALVNDLFGFQQALLGEADITPSGDPETATESQYLAAAKKVIGGNKTVFVESVADALTLGPSVADGTQFDVKGYYSDTTIGGGRFYWDATGTESEDGGLIFGSAAEGRLKRIENSAVSPEDFGAYGDGVEDDGGALVNMAAAAKTNNCSVYSNREDAVYLTSQLIDFSSIRKINLSPSVIKLADSANLSNIVSIINNASPGPVIELNLAVDGNKSNNTTDAIGVLYRGSQTPNFASHVHANNCFVGVDISGNQEMSKFVIQGTGCTTLAVVQEHEGATPDEILMDIIAGACDTILDARAGVSGVARIASEGGGNDYAVKSLAKRLTLSGMIRTPYNGVKITGGSVSFEDLSVFSSTGPGWALLVEGAESLSGSINCLDVINGARIDTATSCTLDVHVSSYDVEGIVLGNDADSKDLNRKIIRVASKRSSGTSGDALRIEGGTGLNVEVTDIDGDIELLSGAIECQISLPAQQYFNSVTNGGTGNSVIYKGAMSTTDRDAIPTPFEGMVVEANRFMDMAPNYYRDGQWVVNWPKSSRTNAGDPNGVLTPHYLGEEVLDTSASNWYKAISTSVNGWKSLTS